MTVENPCFLPVPGVLREDSHEPVYGLSWCLNIHGHDHNGVEAYAEGCKHINLAANVCGYTPVSLGTLVKDGVLSDIRSIHRETIDRAAERKKMKSRCPGESSMISGTFGNNIFEEGSDEK